MVAPFTISDFQRAVYHTKILYNKYLQLYNKAYCNPRPSANLLSIKIMFKNFRK